MNQPVLRHMYVAWQRPDRLIVPVGRLSEANDASGRHYAFAYLKGAEQEDGFRLPGFPDLHRLYESDALFPLFANRIMPSSRADYPEFIEQLHLPADAQPFEVLQRSGGTRATDRIEVFPSPSSVGLGQIGTTFFARGIRHVPGAAEAVNGLTPGDELALETETDNPVNSMAFVLDNVTGERVGWVPNYLLDFIHELDQLNGSLPTVCVEHVNPNSTPPHLRLLCRLTAPYPDGYMPFSGPDFQLLVELAVR